MSFQIICMGNTLIFSLSAFIQNLSDLFLSCLVREQKGLLRVLAKSVTGGYKVEREALKNFLLIGRKLHRRLTIRAKTLHSYSTASLSM